MWLSQTLFLAQLTQASIVGVNQSATQTAAARARVDAGLAGQADLRQGDATALGFADGRFDVVTEQVYVPFFEGRKREYEWWAAKAVCEMLLCWFRWCAPCEYVIAVATK